MIISDNERIAAVVLDEYFPIKAVFSDKIEDLAHIGFYRSNTDLLELTLDRGSGELRSIVLTLCKTYTVKEDCLSLKGVSEIEEAAIYAPSRVDCDYFSVSVYKDGVYVTLLKQAPTSMIKCRNLVFMLSGGVNIAGIAVTGMTAAEISHCITELEYMQ